ncbi:MAG: DUF72 domain-containing protein [Gaiellaceae bacterium]
MTATAASVPGLYVGTSGFSYASWRGAFYPEGAKPLDFLRLYSERLPSVELNATFYRLPSEEQLRTWSERTPPGFRFAVKMSRRITHFGNVDLAGTFCERVRALGDRLGPILCQFPPNRPRDDGLLRLLLDTLDPELEYAFEFRHESWAGADVPVRVNSLEGEAPFRYLRLREPPYDDEQLTAWSERLRPLIEDGVRVYCYFKHEEEPTGPLYAARLLELAGGGPSVSIDQPPG